MQYFVYVIFAGEYLYVGRSHDVIVRLNCHGMLWNDWAILEECGESSIRGRETYWINYFFNLGCKMLNRMKDCSKHGSLHATQETKDKIRAAKLGRPRPDLSERNRLTKPTKVQREALSLALKEHHKSMTPEAKESWHKHLVVQSANANKIRWARSRVRNCRNAS